MLPASELLPVAVADGKLTLEALDDVDCDSDVEGDVVELSADDWLKS